MARFGIEIHRDQNRSSITVRDVPGLVLTLPGIVDASAEFEGLLCFLTHQSHNYLPGGGFDTRGSVPNNISCMDVRGRTLWNIAELTGHGDLYTGLRKVDGRTLYVYTFSGMGFWVDVYSERVVKKQLVK